MCTWCIFALICRFENFSSIHIQTSSSCELKLTLEFVFENLWPIMHMKATEQYIPAVQGGSNFWVCGWNPKVCVYTEQYFSVAFLIVFYKVVLTLEPVNGGLKCELAYTRWFYHVILETCYVWFKLFNPRMKGIAPKNYFLVLLYFCKNWDFCLQF